MDNNVTDDVIDVEDELTKTKDYIKKDKIMLLKFLKYPWMKNITMTYKKSNDHYLVKAKLNLLLANFLSKHNSNKFYLDCFVNFESVEILKEGNYVKVMTIMK